MASNTTSQRRKRILDDGIFELEEGEISGDETTNSAHVDTATCEKSNNPTACASIQDGVTTITCDLSSDIETTLSSSLDAVQSDTGVTPNESTLMKKYKRLLVMYKALEAKFKKATSANDLHVTVQKLQTDNARLESELDALRGKCQCASVICGPQPQKPILKVEFRAGESKQFKDAVRRVISDEINGVAAEDCGDVLTFDVVNKDSQLNKVFPFDDDLFVVDTEQNDVNTWYVPRYGHSLSATMDESVTKEEISPGPSNTSCFNCNGNHTMRECKLPRDHARIRAARNNHQSFKSANCSRYHQEEEDSRFAQFKAGALSTKLREALGANKFQLPEHIYRMRALGYPMGWWQAACQNTRRQLNVIDDDADDETNDMTQMTEEMIYEFPGFNAPMPERTLDEAAKRHLPKFSFRQTKEFLFNSLRKNVVVHPRKRRKLNESTKDDMDLSNDTEFIVQPLHEANTINPPLPPPLPTVEVPGNDKPPPPPPESTPPLPLNKNKTNDDVTIINLDKSESLNDLEAKRRELLAELDMNNSCLDASDDIMIVEHDESSVIFVENDEPSVIEILDDTLCEKNNAKKTDEANSEKETDTKNLIELCSDSSNSVELVNESAKIVTGTTELNRSTNDSQTIRLKTIKTDEGTPILKSHSSYATLPDGENFAKDMGPLLYFENLPESTGKYLKMRGVLSKVKDIMKEINVKKSGEN